MQPDYLVRQRDKPVYPDILWERPERLDQAGKLLIVGGSSNGLRAVADAYETARSCGIGLLRILLPDILRKLTRTMPNIDYAPSTISGSFSGGGRETLMFHAAAADGVLLAGDIGRSSETSLLLSEFVKSYHGPLVVTKDAFDILAGDYLFLAKRPQTLLVITLAQLRRMATDLKWPHAISLDLDFVPLVERLHQLSEAYPVLIISRQYQKLLLLDNGQVIVSDRPDLGERWRSETAARAAVLWLQNLGRPKEALTTACGSFDLSR